MTSESLGFNAEIVMGQSPPGEACNTIGDGLPLLNGPTEYGAHHPTPVQFTTDARKRALPGDLLFCVRGSTTGRMNWADREYAIGRGVAAIRHKTRAELQPFVRAVIEYGLPSLLAQATGSTFPNVSANQLAGLWWPTLSETEQRIIAHVLGSLDDKIELNRRMNETLEALARTLFKSWFVDFDPVRAKMEGRQPAGMDEETAALFPDSFEGSPLGEIPKGWSVEPVYSIADVIYGAPFSSKLFNGEGVGLPILRIRDLATHDPKVYTPEEHPKGTKVKAGDIAVGMDGEFRAHIWTGHDAWLNQRVCMFVPKGNVPKYFVKESLREPLAFFERAKTGTTVIHLGKRDIDTFQLIVPDESTMKVFAKLAEPITGRMIYNVRESRTLAAIRDALLPKLLSGEVRVGQAEEIVEEMI